MNILTFFSESYLPQAHVLIASVYKANPEANIWICALDKGALRIRNSFPNLKYFSWDDVHQMDYRIAETRAERPFVDALFTSVPSILKYCLTRIPEGESLLYMDADIAVFQSLLKLEEAFAESDIGIFPHEFGIMRHAIFKRFGTFNAGSIMVRNTEIGEAFLHRWQDLCLEWCEDRAEQGRFANQGYLDELANSFPRVIEFYNLGANKAPWNTSFGPSNRSWGKPSSEVIFFHYHGISVKGGTWYFAHLRFFRLLSKAQIAEIYLPYLTQLEKASARYIIRDYELPRHRTNHAIDIISNSIYRFASKVLGQTLSTRDLP